MKSNQGIILKRNYIVFVGVLFIIYIIIVLIQYSKKNTVFSYQVKEGTLAENNIYTGLIIRKEEVFPCNQTGFIDYFAREGEHVGVGDLIYTIDESGVIEDMINDNLGENSLSDEDLRNLKSEAGDFATSFSDENFKSVYDFEYSIDGMVLKLANMNILNKLSDYNSKSLSDLVKLNKATTPGYVVYNIDGYESVSVNAINSAMFDEKEYEKTQLVNNSLVDEGDNAYKLIESEEWNIVIMVDEAKAKEIKDEGYIEVKFVDTQRTVWAEVEVYQDGENYYAVLGFNTGVMNYCASRYVDIELINESKMGLKIPNSSIVHKEFFLIPKMYAVEKGEDNTYYFIRKEFNDDGSVEAKLVSAEVYAEDDDNFYVDGSFLHIGDYLLTQDSQNEFPVSTKAELMGVYNMNKGYADFRQIVILYQNEEYAIVKSNTAYGLNEYDYIVLDSSTVTEDAFIYE